MAMEREVVKEKWVRGETIGRGSYGTVSLGVNKSSGAVFAVKSVERSSCSSSHQLEALENEIRILRSLSSPYVVEYLGDGVTVEDASVPAASGHCFRNLYLEYLTGGTVADLARDRNPGADVDEEIVKNYTFCLVSALKYLHSEGIVHCDIKGDNVLVAGPNSFTAKLVDFGSAMELDLMISPSCGKDETKNKNGKILPRGSPLWMAPEVIRGEYQGPESDVWSLGCTIIEMVTGKPAWEDKGPAATLLRIGYSELLPVLPTQLSELGLDFLNKCLRRDPNERWSSDQLLKHPFISTLASPGNSAYQFTPRCILDWFSLDSDEEDDEEKNKLDDDDDEICISRVKDRIRELASGTSPNWESDGWTVVRSSKSTDAGRCSSDDDEEEEEEGTSLKYPELMRVGSEIERPGLDHVDSTEIGLGNGRTSGEYLLDSSRSPLQEYQNHSGDVVVSRDLRVVHLLLLFYLLSNFSRENYNKCTQFTILLRYTRIFWYTILLLDIKKKSTIFIIILSLGNFFFPFWSEHYYYYYCIKLGGRSTISK